MMNGASFANGQLSSGSEYSDGVPGRLNHLGALNPDPIWLGKALPRGSLRTLSNASSRMLLLQTTRPDERFDYAVIFGRVWPGRPAPCESQLSALVKSRADDINKFLIRNRLDFGEIEYDEYGGRWRSGAASRSTSLPLPVAGNHEAVFRRGSVEISGVSTYWQGTPLLNSLDVRTWQKQRLISLLALNPDRLIDSEAIFPRLGWTTDLESPSERSALVQTVVSSLRRDILQVDPSSTPIRTVRGQGYIWHDHRAERGPEVIDVDLDARSGEITYLGQVIDLYGKRARLLKALLWASPEYVSNRTLVGIMNGSDQVGELTEFDLDALRTHFVAIKNLFTAINPRFAQIQNRRSFGYAWVDPVRR